MASRSENSPVASHLYLVALLHPEFESVILAEHVVPAEDEDEAKRKAFMRVTGIVSWLPPGTRLPNLRWRVVRLDTP